MKIAPPRSKITLVASAKQAAGRRFWVSILAQRIAPAAQVKLTLPSGITLASGEAEVKDVPAPAADSPQAMVRWLVRSDAALIGAQELSAEIVTSALADRCQIVFLPPQTSLQFLPLRNPVQVGRAFWVVAIIENAETGQQVTLQLPPGWKFGGDQQARQQVPVTAQEFAQLNWLIVADKQGRAVIKSQLAPTSLVAELQIQVGAPASLLD